MTLYVTLTRDEYERVESARHLVASVPGGDPAAYERALSDVLGEDGARRVLDAGTAVFDYASGMPRERFREGR